MGVFPSTKRWPSLWPRLPHARGGVSTLLWYGETVEPSSPRSWGCFSTGRGRTPTATVFPTLVGVFLVGHSLPHHGQSLPHARGGVSDGRRPSLLAAASSPRSWGCFCGPSWASIYRAVFPTLVGVFLMTCRFLTDAERLPHARGGVSRMLPTCWAWPRSSPRSWGCF